jgi:hypothetical protein
MRFQLGSHVRLVEAGDLTGIVIEHMRHLDGSERYTVEYWHEAEKKEAKCMERELELVAT